MSGCSGDGMNIFDDADEAVYTAQVIKYVWRWKWKNGAEDLRTARFYLDKLIAMEEDNGEEL